MCVRVRGYEECQAVTQKELVLSSDLHQSTSSINNHIYTFTDENEREREPCLERDPAERERERREGYYMYMCNLHMLKYFVVDNCRAFWIS